MLSKVKRREAISLLLGDWREFQNCTEQVHLSGLSAEERATALLTAIYKKLSIQEEQGTQITAKNFVDVLLKFIPVDYFNVYSEVLRVKPDKWEDWLQICWGHDDDTLTILSNLPKIETETELQNFVESVGKLPIIQSPELNNSELNNSEQIYIDNHIHLGLLCPPSLQWAHWINTGFHYKHYLVNKRKHYSKHNLNGYELSEDKIEEHCKGIQLSDSYLNVARVLIGALLDFYKIPNSSNKPINLNNDEAKCSKLIKQVTDGLYTEGLDNQLDRETLASLLATEFSSELKNSSDLSQHLSKSTRVGEPFYSKEDVSLFLKHERKCIATLLWKAYNNKLGSFFQEVLFTYLRCKGAWFQINSGNKLEKLQPSEHVLLKTYDLSIVRDDNSDTDYVGKFHNCMSAAVRDFYYLDSKFLEKVELRLPFIKNLDIAKNILWLRSIYERVNCDLVLSFPRYTLNEKDGHYNKTGEYLNFIKSIKNIVDENTTRGFRICGVDLVGTHENIDWSYYGQLLRELKSDILKITPNESCFVTYHLNEDNNLFPLKEICEILTIVKEGKLEEHDRISYGWSLLLKADKSNDKNVDISSREWDLIENWLGKLKKDLPTEQKQIINDLKSYRNESARLDSDYMSKLADFLQPLVQEELINKGILLEVCPTSSWRIAGIPPFTEHPVESWIRAGGEVLVGTDNPAVFPCTIESEYYMIESIKKKLSMPNETTPTATSCAVILTAIPIEYSAVRAHLTDLQEEHVERTIYERGKFMSNGQTWEVVIAAVGQGNLEAAMKTKNAITYFKPSVILFVGIAGGIKDVKLGDVVAATKVYYYESGKESGSKFQTRPEAKHSTNDLVERARVEANKTDWHERIKKSEQDNVAETKVYVEPIVSGEKVIASRDSSSYELIRDSYNDAIATEMEGGGFLAAAHENQQVSALVIRGISDLIDGKSETDKTGYREIAARNASAFAFEILAKFKKPYIS
ncbi:MAG TPA: hypothetical protein VK184_07450 [Nostocaceae cyanobacterium]|nr:hypothetical protein [Nostocaceae cyanobacterium]